MNEKLINQRNIFCYCSSKVIAFLAFLLSFTLGLIFGALFAEVFLSELPILITSAVLLGVMILAILIFKKCNCCRHKPCSE